MASFASSFLVPPGFPERTVSTRQEIVFDALQQAEALALGTAERKPRLIQTTLGRHPTHASLVRANMSGGETDSDRDSDDDYHIQFAERREVPAVRDDGLGLLAQLKDWMVLDIFRLLDAAALRQAALVSKAFYVFATEEDLWKKLVIARDAGDYRFKGTWKSTCLRARDAAPADVPGAAVSIRGFMSRFLYRRWYRSLIPMDYFHQEFFQVERRGGPLTSEQFRDEYLLPNKPVILTDVCREWPAMSEWMRDRLLAKWRDQTFRGDEVGPDGRKMRLPFGNYVDYMVYNRDEDPIYLFDPNYGENIPEMLSQYRIPDWFREDYFQHVGETDRPQYRWVVLGGPRTGSAFHVDPHHTSAWNALLYGKKRWILFPPDFTPPGVRAYYDSDGDLDHDAPDPMRWMIEHYPHVKRGANGPFEVTQNAGEMIFVPSGWWHMVLNVTETIAVTQNFVDQGNFPYVMRDLKDSPSSRKLLARFRKRAYQPCRDLFDKHDPETGRILAEHPELTTASSSGSECSCAECKAKKTGDTASKPASSGSDSAAGSSAAGSSAASGEPQEEDEGDAANGRTTASDTASSLAVSAPSSPRSSLASSPPGSPRHTGGGAE